MKERLELQKLREMRSELEQVCEEWEPDEMLMDDAYGQLWYELDGILGYVEEELGNP